MLGLKSIGWCVLGFWGANHLVNLNFIFFIYRLMVVAELAVGIADVCLR
jgi:hypothetical protein